MDFFNLFKKQFLSIFLIAAFLSALSFVLDNHLSLLTGLNVILGVSAYMFYIAYVDITKKADQLEIASKVAPKPWLGVKDFVDAQIFPTLILDQNDIITHLNQIMVETFNDETSGHQKSLLLEQHISSLIRSPQILSVYDQVKSTGKSAQFKFEHSDVGSRYFWLNISPITTDKNKVFYCFTFRDLTKDQKMEQMRADFVANASHELRTPLASISGFIETLLGPAKDDKKNHERFLTIMQQQADRMTRLIDDLLSLSKIEMNMHVKPQDEVDLYEIADHSLKSFEPLAKEKHVDLVFDAKIDKAIIKADKDQLLQLLGNLLNNAFKYGLRDEKDNRIILRLTEDADAQKFIISVIDFGHGIPQTDLPRLTERFYRISNHHKTSGTGLGLAIVKHIVQRHGGELLFKSQIDQGTKAEVSFNRT